LLEQPENVLYALWKNASEDESPELLDKLLGEVRRHARNVVFNKLAESDEELVELIVRAVRQGLPTFRREAKFSTWVHSVASNHVFQKLRSRIRERRVFDYRVEVNDEMPEVRQANPDLRIQVEQLAKGLSEEERLIYWAKYEGYMNQEISEQLGATEDAVESQWRRIVEKIRKRARHRRNTNGSGN